MGMFMRKLATSRESTITDNERGSYKDINQY